MTHWLTNSRCPPQRDRGAAHQPPSTGNRTMSLSALLRRVFFGSAPRVSRPRVRHATLQVEGLEERALMSAGGLDPTFGTGGRVTNVQATGRLVEGVPRLERPRGLVVDRPLVLALDDVAKDRAGVAVWSAGLSRTQ